MKKTGRVVLITGDSSGFGLQIAKLFLANGDSVCGFSKQDKGLEEVYHQVGDVSSFDSCKDAVDNVIKKYGHIDVLINDAGFGIFGPVEETEPNRARKLIEVNFRGYFYRAKACLPYRRENGGGRIINISSIAAVVPLPFQAFYSAGKAARESLFDSLRPEVRPYNILISHIRPGDAKTGFTANRIKEARDKNSPYCAAFCKCLKQVEKDETTGVEAIFIARAAFKTANKKHPRFVVSVGRKDRFLSGLYHSLPRRRRNYLLYKVYAEK